MNQRQQQGKRTRPEVVGYSILTDLGLEHIAQYMIDGKFCVDAYLPEQRIVIQFDGDYWHGRPEKYSSLDHRQKKRVNLDHSQDAYMRKHGYTVLRFWESEILGDPAAIRRRIVEQVVQLGARRS